MYSSPQTMQPIMKRSLSGCWRRIASPRSLQDVILLRGSTERSGPILRGTKRQVALVDRQKFVEQAKTQEIDPELLDRRLRLFRERSRETSGSRRRPLDLADMHPIGELELPAAIGLMPSKRSVRSASAAASAVQYPDGLGESRSKPWRLAQPGGRAISHKPALSIRARLRADRHT